MPREAGEAESNLLFVICRPENGVASVLLMPIPHVPELTPSSFTKSLLSIKTFFTPPVPATN
jgi:hypothetical protein